MDSNGFGNVAIKRSLFGHRQFRLGFGQTFVSIGTFNIIRLSIFRKKNVLFYNSIPPALVVC